MTEEETKPKDLQEIFAEHFARDDIEGAQRWMRKWYDKDNQIAGGFDYTVRSMSGHVSDYLEGFSGNEPHSYNGSSKWYIDTKYGSTMYHAAFTYQPSFAGYAADLTRNWGIEEHYRRLKEVCLHGPRVLNGLAPTQEALNRFIGPHLSLP